MTLPILARYEFISAYQRGTAAELRTPDPLAGPVPGRARLDLDVRLRSRAGAEQREDTATAAAALYGPGDVAGLDVRQIFRTEPRTGTMNCEANYLAGIDFDHPELPWMFTPAAANGSKLRPWLALLVCADGEFELIERVPDPLPVVKITAPEALPDLTDSWAWAHVQVTGGLPQGASVAALQAGEPERVFSRLLSFRRLRPQTRYTAFLVPAFDLGVRAGLGSDVPVGPTVAAQPAWAAGQAPIDLPYYHRFDFGTAPTGDFETLVRALVPRLLPAEVGIRPMSVDRPGWGLPSAGTPLGLSGALRSVQTTDTPWNDPDRSAFRAAIAAEVNRSSAPLDGPEDPIVTPPLYGRWHAARSAIDHSGTGWHDILNSDPRHRAMAGLGTRVVLDQRNQLMHSAWQQVDGIGRANQLLRQAQLARSASELLLSKHLAGADPATLLALTEPLHARLLASPRTVKATLTAGALPSGIAAPAFRRVARGHGPLRRRQGARGRAPSELWERVNAGYLNPAPPPKRPDGLVALGESASGADAPRGPSGRPTWLPAWLADTLLRLPLVLLIAMAIVAGVVLGMALAVLTGSAVVSLIGGVAGAAAATIAIVRLRVRLRAGPGSPDESDAPGTAPDAVGAGLTHEDLTPEAFAVAPPRPEFVVMPSGAPQPEGNWPSPRRSGPDSADAAAFRAAARELARRLAVADPVPYPAREEIGLRGIAETVLNRLEPAITIPARITRVISVLPRLPAVHWDPDRLDEVMAHPDFPQPMYEPLRDLSQDFILPGLDRVPRNTLGVLKENRPFLESYMVGLNHELARQLLWNKYPTDQRGSYFRQFWDIRCYVPMPSDPSDPAALRELLKDIRKIHNWPHPSALGDHPKRPPPPGGRIILLVRGDLFRRYPNTVVCASKAVWDAGDRRHDLPVDEEQINPVFRGTLDPDVSFFGFDLSEDEARGADDHSDPRQGWFFVFQEQPAEPRFGLAPEPEPFLQPPMAQWNDLSWAHMAPDAVALADLEHLRPSPMFGGSNPPSAMSDGTNPQDPNNRWAEDAAQIAYVLLRRPARIAVHARTMLPGTS